MFLLFPYPSWGSVRFILGLFFLETGCRSSAQAQATERREAEALEVGGGR